jgi:hypothetical protein
MLTQERLAELLEEEAGVSGYSGIRVSNWERAQEIIRQDNRDLLIGLLYVLHRHGGLSTLDEANSFLFAGGYRNLDKAEIHKVNPSWLEQPDQVVNAEKAREATRPSHRRSFITIFTDGIRRWFTIRPGRIPVTTTFSLYSSTCGDAGIDLGQQRLLLSATFGSYFAGLLERQHSYVELQGQIVAPVPLNQELLTPIERIFWALQYAKGPRLLVIAAEGGMGKSTLAGKIVRCLFQEQAIDMILGDSAKSQQVNLITGTITQIKPGYYDTDSFYERLCSQLGLPYKAGQINEKQLLTAICDRLIGRRAIVVLDNLENLEQGADLLHALKTITGRDIRAVVTTRTVRGLSILSSDMMVIHLQPITLPDSAYAFLTWHVHHHQDEHPRLRELNQELDNKKRLQMLIDRTGGIPLLMQLVLSDVARYSWSYLDQLPHLFGQALLGFLYKSRWEELGDTGYAGKMSQQLLRWVAGEQYRGRKVSVERMVQWGQAQERPEILSEALRLLHERFLIVNHDPERGNFVLFPSLIEFVQKQE